MFEKLSNEQINQIYELIRNYWQRYLRRGVELPKLKIRNIYTKDALVLVYLARGYPNNLPVTKEELTYFIRQYFPETTDVQQARHLARQKGWYIISSARGNHRKVVEERGINFLRNSYYIVSLEKSYPSWIPNRRIGISEENFEELEE